MLFPFKSQGKISETVQQLLLQVRELFGQKKGKEEEGRKKGEKKERSISGLLLCFSFSGSSRLEWGTDC